MEKLVRKIHGNYYAIAEKSLEFYLGMTARRFLEFSTCAYRRALSLEKFRRSWSVCPYSFLLATVGPCRNRAFRRSGANRESDEGVKEKGGKC